MSFCRVLPAAIAAALLVSACTQKPADAPAAGGEPAARSTASTDEDTAAATAPDTPADAKPFDIEAVPMSDRPLGEFPYLALPAGYSNERRGSGTKDFARFPFWVDGQARWVEGRFYFANFSTIEGKQFSQYEVSRNIEAVIEQLGGVKVSEGNIPSDTVKSWGEEITMGFNDGLGDVYNAPATTYLVRRSDGNIWVHLVTDTAQGWMVVGKEQAFQPSASPLPAAAPPPQ